MINGGTCQTTWTISGNVTKFYLVTMPFIDKFAVMC